MLNLTALLIRQFHTHKVDFMNQLWMYFIWATSRENVSAEIFDQVTFKPTCSAREAS